FSGACRSNIFIGLFFYIVQTDNLGRLSGAQ
ncbi:MAG: hypothetical protein ACJAT7_003685, partial [Psychromonas sp.]